jgi:hypothetical protein
MWMGEPMAEEMPEKSVGARPLHDRVLAKPMDAGDPKKKKKLGQQLYGSTSETAGRSRPREPQFNIREAATTAYAADLPEPSKAPQPEIELVQRAADVLGSERVAAWMQKSIPSLGGRTPYSLLA